MFPFPTDSRVRMQMSPASGLAIVVLVALASPVAASEVMGAIPPKSAPAPIIKSLVREHKAKACGCGNGSVCKQHRPASHCDGRCGNGGCGKPGCPAHCPVRPDRFGFYGTQWRVWPGQDVVQASYDEAATPVRPPKSEVPDADEESPSVAPELLPGEEPGEAAPAAEPLPPARSPAKDDAKERESPFADEPAAEQPKAAEPAPAEEPAVEKPSVPAAEENLFDEASHRSRRHELLASLQYSAIRAELARKEALRQQAFQSRREAHSGLPETSEAPTPSGIQRVAHEEPVAPTAMPPQRSNPLR